TGLSKRAAAEAIASTREIADRCTVTLPKAAAMRYPMDVGADRHAYWIEQLRDGWLYRGIDDRVDVARYVERLKYEVGVIEDKDFVDYFLIVGDMVRWAKEH